MGRGKKRENDLRDEIMKSARKLFSSFGFRKTAVDEIAKGANVAKGTIYNYFHSKDDLIRATYKKELDELLIRIQEKVKEAQDAGQKLVNLFLEKIKGISESSVLLQVWNKQRRELGAGLDKEMEDFERKEAGLIEEILRNEDGIVALAGYELGGAGELIQKAFRGIELSYLDGCQNRVREKIEKLTELILEGFKKSLEKDRE